MKTINQTLAVFTFTTVLLFCGCGTTKQYEQAKTTNTIAAYESFLAENPKSKFTEQARLELNSLYEEKDWNNALATSTIAGYKQFIAKYPDGRFGAEAGKRIAELEEQQAWDKSLNLNTIIGYESFLASFPASKYSAEANARIKELKEDMAWDETVRTGTIASYEEFINDFPDGKNHSKALKKLNELESIAAEWDKACRVNTIEAYHDYLSLFPSGDYSEEAEKRMVDLEVDAIFKGDHGTLPSMNRISSGEDDVTTNQIEIYNNTQYNLTVYYSGLQSKKVVFSPKERITIELVNGEYRIAASVDAADVGNYAGTEKLEGGSYDIEYYIVTQTYYH